MEVPVDLLTKAQEASGAGITQTICAGLQLIAAGMAYERLLQLPGKVQFWYPAGKLRSKALARKRKARLGDALIAQCCFDADIPLITRDRDFKAFPDTLKLNLF